MAVFTKLAAAAWRRFSSNRAQRSGNQTGPPKPANDPNDDPNAGTAVIGAREDDATSASRQPFTGTMDRLDRLATVRPGTVVVGFEAGNPPALRAPGELLIPSWLPFVAGVDVLPVTTEPVDLDVRVKDLMTMDGQPIDHVDLEVTVQLDDANDHAVVAALASEHGPTFGSHLMRGVLHGVESGVRGAIRMNNLNHLRQQSVVQVLQDRWMPRSFAAGALIQRGFTVREVAWPQQRSPGSADGRALGSPSPARNAKAADHPRADETEHPPKDGAGPHQPRLELSMDARLARVWRANCRAGLRGIAYASVRESVTVLAVSEADPGAYESHRLSELFGDLLTSRQLSLVVAVADGYEDLIRAWFGQVSGSGAVLEVEATDREQVLRVHLDFALVTAEHARRGQPSSDGSEAQALLHLLPYRAIEFVTDTPPDSAGSPATDRSAAAE